MVNLTKQYSIQGSISATNLQLKLQGLLVRVWDKYLVFEEMVGTTLTDRNGNFSLNVQCQFYEDLFFERKPELIMEVFYHGKCLYRSANFEYSEDEHDNYRMDIQINTSFHSELISPKEKIFVLPANSAECLPRIPLQNLKYRAYA
ncbi:MAG: hypothetical protein ACFCUU_09140 [Cyclobacteriaceae bacterium]